MTLHGRTASPIHRDVNGTPWRNSRRGSTYLIVLFTSLIVATIAFAGFRRLQVQEYTDTLERDWHDSAVLANAAVEHALTKLGNDHDWRRAYGDQTDGRFTSPVALGRGTIRWQLEDPDDGDLDDDPDDPVRIYGAGRIGDSERVFSVLAWPTGNPLDVLRSAVHAGGPLEIASNADVRSGPASSNQALTIGAGTLLGDAEAMSIDVPEQVVGTFTLLPKPKLAPNASIYSMYRTLAATIPNADLGTGSMLFLENRLVCGDTAPTLGTSVQTDGLYSIQLLDNQSLTIRNCRIAGTVLVELGQNSVLTIGPNVVWRPLRADYPALLAEASAANATVVIESAGILDEALANVNFNPTYAPYFGDSDTDILDRYTATLRGLFHIIRQAGSPGSQALTTVRSPQKIFGCLLVDGALLIDSKSVFVADPMLTAKPPLGYTTFPNPSNGLINGDMESGLAGWVKLGANTVLTPTSPAFAGTACLAVTDRDTASSGVQQDITTRIANRKPLLSELWIKLDNAPEAIKITLEIESSIDGVQRYVATVDANTQWQRIQTEHLPTWNGALIAAKWQVTTTTTTQTLWLDEAIVHDPNDGPTATLSAVPGTWRAEAVPDP